MANFLGSNQVDLSFALDNNFKVFVEKLPTVTFFATESALPEFTMPGASVDTPMQDYILQDNKIQWNPIEIGFMIDEGFFAYEEVYNWMWNTVKPTNTENSGFYYSDAMIQILDNNKNGILAAKFTDCFPVGLSAVKYVTQGEAMALVATVSLRYTYMTLQRQVDLTPPIPPPLSPITL